MVLTIVITKLKSLVLFIFVLFRRVLCCFRRRRRQSFDAVPLTNINIVSNHEVVEDNQDNWIEWSKTTQFVDSFKTVQDHIDSYRKNKMYSLKPPEPEDVVQQEDLFESMAPKITKQTKIYVNTENQNDAESKRLSFAPESVNITNELEEWEESSGWEGQTLDWDAQEALREKKRKDRERRAWEQQQKRQERSNRPFSLGAKLST